MANHEYDLRTGHEIRQQHCPPLQGVPNSIVTDNGTQFTGSRFLEFCDEYHISIDLPAVAHPRANGQVERANGMIMQGLMSWFYTHFKQLDQQRSQVLTTMLWSLRTTPNHSTGYTPYIMVYGAKAVLPTDIEYCASRLKLYISEQNESSLQDALDQLNEAHNIGILLSARYQHTLQRYHSHRIRKRTL